jgi:hypothetical protein
VKWHWQRRRTNAYLRDWRFVAIVAIFVSALYLEGLLALPQWAHLALQWGVLPLST